MTKIQCNWINCKYNKDTICTKESIKLENIEWQDEQYLNCYDYESKNNKV